MADESAGIQSEKTREELPIDEYVGIDLDFDSLQFLFDFSKSLAGKLFDLASVFSDNLVAVITNASATWVFARRAGYRTAYQSLVGVSLGVRSVVTPGEPAKTAHEKLDEHLKIPKWRGTLDNMAGLEARQMVVDFLENDVSRACAATVLSQCTVLTWSAFEILASDLFTTLLNENPHLTARLLKSEHTKKLYQSKEFAAALEENKYDLSKCMGDVLLRQARMDRLDTIRCVYEVLFEGNESLRQALGDCRIWRLWKTRNLIVHRAGVVDELFRTSTGIDVPIGSKIKITPALLMSDLLLVGKAGVELLAAARLS
jgi:hypothetical protein